MNLKELLEDCYRRLALPAAPNPTETVRLTAFLNSTQRQIVGLPGLETLRDESVTFTSVPGQSIYSTYTVARIQGITDKTSQRKLRLMSLQELRESDPGVTAGGTPDSYIYLGNQQVHHQPVTPVLVPYAKSDDPNEVAVDVFIEGIDGRGYPVGATARIQGTTPVGLPITGGIAYSQIYKFYLSMKTNNTISLWTTNTLTEELARIWPGSTYARYATIQLYPTPTSVNTYYMDYVWTILDMVNQTDEPLLPIDFHWLLVEGVMVKEWTKRDDDRRVAAEREYAKGISALKYFVTSHGDDLPVSGQWPRMGGHSRYGPYYPATRY